FPDDASGRGPIVRALTAEQVAAYAEEDERLYPQGELERASRPAAPDLVDADGAVDSHVDLDADALDPFDVSGGLDGCDHRDPPGVGATGFDLPELNITCGMSGGAGDCADNSDAVLGVTDDGIVVSVPNGAVNAGIRDADEADVSVACRGVADVAATRRRS